MNNSRLRRTLRRSIETSQRVLQVAQPGLAVKTPPAWILAKAKMRAAPKLMAKTTEEQLVQKVPPVAAIKKVTDQEKREENKQTGECGVMKTGVGGREQEIAKGEGATGKGEGEGEGEGEHTGGDAQGHQGEGEAAEGGPGN